MADSLAIIQQSIISHPYFQKTKEVVENNQCHHDEKVYDHLLGTAKRAEELVKGDFISNSQAKKLFDEWMDSEIDGMKQKDIAIITALIHDIGKILVYEKNGTTQSIIEKDKNGETIALGHEYFGSTLIPKILTDIGMSGDVIYRIAMVVKLHGILMFPEFESKTLQEHISDMKALGQGLEKEILFNTVVDVALCPMFDNWVKVIKNMFGEESLYERRNYVVSSI